MRHLHLRIPQIGSRSQEPESNLITGLYLLKTTELRQCGNVPLDTNAIPLIKKRRFSHEFESHYHNATTLIRCG